MQMRIALARLLLGPAGQSASSGGQGGLLLLDEPTNHLDRWPSCTTLPFSSLPLFWAVVLSPTVLHACYLMNMEVNVWASSHMLNQTVLMYYKLHAWNIMCRRRHALCVC